MDKNLAIRMTHLVNTQEEVLKEYTEGRIERLFASLELAKTLEELYLIKGQLKEVRRLLSLKEEVKAAREEN